jgi:hypothetical protein
MREGSSMPNAAAAVRSEPQSPASSSLHQAVFRLSKAVETIEARLRRIETGMPA